MTESLNIFDYTKSLTDLMVEKLSDVSGTENYYVEKNDIKFNQTICAIYLSAFQFQVAFFVHYKYEFAAQLCTNRFKKTVDQLTFEEINDGMKELCNLIGGRLAYAINEKGMNIAYGLPFTIQGLNQIVVNSMKYENSQQKCWRFRKNELVLDFSLQYSCSEDYKNYDLGNLPADLLKKQESEAITIFSKK